MFNKLIKWSTIIYCPEVIKRYVQKERHLILIFQSKCLDYYCPCFDSGKVNIKIVGSDGRCVMGLKVNFIHLKISHKTVFNYL